MIKFPNTCNNSSCCILNGLKVDTEVDHIAVRFSYLILKERGERVRILNLISNLGDNSNIQTIHFNTCFFIPIIAITPFELVLAVPDLKFFVRLHRQRVREIIKEHFWPFGCGPRQAVKLAIPII